MIQRRKPNGNTQFVHLGELRVFHLLIVSMAAMISFAVTFLAMTTAFVAVAMPVAVMMPWGS